MEINITSIGYEKRVKLQEIINTLKAQETDIGLENARLFIDYPIFQDYENMTIFPTMCIISKQKGIIIVFINEDTRTESAENTIKMADQTLNNMISLLIKSSKLRESRQTLKVNISTFIFSKYLEDEMENANNLGLSLTDEQSDLLRQIKKIQSIEIESDVYDEMCSIVEGIKSIQKQKIRKIPDGYDSSKGSLLEKLSDQISLFDRKQRIAALSLIAGPQRIRGLAGSGKTVILAIKTAIYHLRYPEKKILYTFWTKSLYDQVKLLISKFYRIYSTNDPNWDVVHVKHAWGGANLSGVYYDACINNGVSPLSFQEAKKANKGNEFGFICEQLLENTKGNLKKEYDLVLIDEGQDFPAPFYWLCRKIVKNDSLVWAYDELQNVLNVEIQNSMNLFRNKYGDEGIDLNALSNEYYKNDLVLDVCYRNPLEILMVAHGLGFGIYNETILQMLENGDHWSDLGYRIVTGDCIKDHQVKIERPESNSPSIISSLQTKAEILNVKIFKSLTEEIDYVVNEIDLNLKDFLAPEDIMIICLDDRNSKTYFAKFEEKLFEKNINVNNIVNSFAGDHFLVKGAVTLTTVYRAKGNESGIVYVVGSDAFDMFSRNNINIRNKLFTAITRAKGWVRITGLQAMDWIDEEIKMIMENIPFFKFTYPDLEQIKTLRRELTKEAEENNRNIKELIERMDSMGLAQEDVIKYMIKIAKADK